MGLLGERAAGKGEARLEKGEPPAAACQPWPPAFLSFPPESPQEPHCFVPLAQGLGLCYTPAKLWGSCLQQRGKWAAPACGRGQHGAWQSSHLSW